MSKQIQPKPSSFSDHETYFREKLKTLDMLSPNTFKKFSFAKDSSKLSRVFLVYSCKKNLEKAELLYYFIYENLTRKVLIVYGRDDDEFSLPYEIINEKYLVLNVRDDYMSLSTKTIYMLYITRRIFDESVKGIIKCDDDIVPNVLSLRNCLLENENTDYFGMTTKVLSHYSNYFMKKTELPEKERVKCFVPACTYCNGPIYSLSMSAIDKILLPIHSIKYNAFEDVMIGLNFASGKKSYQSLCSLHRTDKANEVLIISVHNDLNLKCCFFDLDEASASKNFENIFLAGIRIADKCNRFPVAITESNDIFSHKLYGRVLLIRSSQIKYLSLSSYNTSDFEDHKSYLKSILETPHNKHILLQGDYDVVFATEKQKRHNVKKRILLR